MAENRFTLEGGPEIEARIAAIVAEVVEKVKAVVPKDRVRSFALIGGYGRGEGGIEIRDRQELLHNNLDFLLITRDFVPRGLKEALDSALSDTAERSGVGIDIGVIADKSLARSPCLVIWYDARFGHKTLFGDPEFLKSLTHFRLENIEPFDMRDLLVNRGTLFIINRVLFGQGHLTEQQRKSAIRHIMKGIIGYGDAWLFFNNDYHWSYGERRRRMAHRMDAPKDLRDLYEKAMSFRFRGNYADFDRVDIAAFNEQVLNTLEAVHLAIERLRLKRPNLSWEGYATTSLLSYLTAHPLSLRFWAKKIRSAFFGGRNPKNLLHYMLWKLAPPRERIAVIFPAVAYAEKAKGSWKVTEEVLGADMKSAPMAVQLAYLRLWGKYGDPNFPISARRLGLEVSNDLPHR